MKTYSSLIRASLSLLAALAFSVTAFAQPTLVSTSPTTGATGVATNFAFIQVEDALTSQTVYESPDLGSPGALTGASNQVLFTAGTFQPGHTCDVHVERYVVFSNSVSGALSLAGYGAVTQSKLRTIGGAMSHIVRITSPTRLGNSFSVVVSLGTNATYNFERTVDLTNRTRIQSLVPTSTNIQAVVDLSPPNGPAFYRFRRE